MHRRWLAGAVPDPGADVRLFCLPYAGGSAAAFRPWRALSMPALDVCPLELPGRGTRLREQPFRRLGPLVTDLADALDPLLDRPFALFGHSMGALVAFELARTLRERGRPAPVQLLVSAAAPPHTPPSRPLLHCADDHRLRERLRELNGTPQELLDNEDLMALMLPVLRADFAVLETYEYREQTPLPVPMTVFGGTSDPVVATSSLGGWRAHTGREVRLRLFPGDHFFLHGARRQLLGEIHAALGVRSWATPSADVAEAVR